MAMRPGPAYEPAICTLPTQTSPTSSYLQIVHGVATTHIHCEVNTTCPESTFVRVPLDDDGASLDTTTNNDNERHYDYALDPSALHRGTQDSAKQRVRRGVLERSLPCFPDGRSQCRHDDHIVGILGTHSDSARSESGIHAFHAWLLGGG